MKTPPEPSIPYLIHRIAVRIEDSINAKARKYGLKVSEIRVLLRLLDHGDMRVGELASLTSLEPSALSHILRRIGEAGWVTRMRAPQDARQVLVSLTEKGRRLARLLHPHIRRYNDIAGRGIARPEIARLRAALDQIYENLLGMEKSLPDFPDFAAEPATAPPRRRVRERR
jgi:DNA-binding MarR family transcriptional regulator